MVIPEQQTDNGRDSDYRCIKRREVQRDTGPEATLLPNEPRTPSIKKLCSSVFQLLEGQAYRMVRSHGISIIKIIIGKRVHQPPSTFRRITPSLVILVPNIFYGHSGY